MTKRPPTSCCWRFALAVAARSRIIPLVAGRHVGRPGLVSANGRISPSSVDAAVKSPVTWSGTRARRSGRSRSVVAQIDVAELKAQRAKYVADMAMQEASLETKATVEGSDAPLNLKEANLQRAAQLVRTEAVSQRTLDEAARAGATPPGDLAATERTSTRDKVPSRRLRP